MLFYCQSILYNLHRRLYGLFWSQLFTILSDFQNLHNKNEPYPSLFVTNQPFFQFISQFCFSINVTTKKCFLFHVNCKISSSTSKRHFKTLNQDCPLHSVKGLYRTIRLIKSTSLKSTQYTKLLLRIIFFDFHICIWKKCSSSCNHLNWPVAEKNSKNEWKIQPTLDSRFRLYEIRSVRIHYSVWQFISWFKSS